MTRRHESSDRQRNHRAGQMKIKHTCACGRVLIGNAAWHSHLSPRRDGCTSYDLHFGGGAL